MSFENIKGTTSNIFYIGNLNPTDGNIIISANINEVDKPSIRWNSTENSWQYSNDGTSWNNFGTGTGRNSTTYINVGKIGELSAGITGYLLTNLSETDNEDYIVFLATSDGYLSNLRVSAGTAAGSGNSATFTVRINGIDTLLSTALSNANTNAVSSNAVMIAAGEKVTIKFITSSPCLVSNVMISCEYVATAKTVSNVITVGKIGELSAATDGYLLTNLSETDNEDFGAFLVGSNGQLSNMHVSMSQAPTGNVAFILRVNKINTIINVNIAGNSTNGEEIINNTTVSSGDIVTVRFISDVDSVAKDVIVAFEYKVNLP
ncbi:MAG: hypothetical protein ACOYO1_05095 [Bacteroidales bacterium]